MPIGIINAILGGNAASAVEAVVQQVKEEEEKVSSLVESFSISAPKKKKKKKKVSDIVGTITGDVVPALLGGANPPPSMQSITERTNKFSALKAANLREVTKRIRPEFENFAKNFASDEPEILFTCEYVIEDVFAGVLIVWEKYFDATHYEVFKKNLFQSNASFERILFLDAVNLREETGHFFPYLRDTLGMDELNEREVFIMLDHHVKQDRIYEYTVQGARIPQNANQIDYDMILESQELLNKTTLSEGSNDTIFNVSGRLLGSDDLAWMLSLINEQGFRFFGRKAAEQSLINLIGPPNDGEDYSAFTPKHMNDILSIIEDSISLFGIKQAYKKIVDVAGGLPREFRAFFLNSVDEARNVFSLDNYRNEVLQNVPTAELIVEIAESRSEEAVQALSKLSIKVPTDEGSAPLTTIDGITKAFKFANEFALAILYSQDEQTFEKLKQIYDKIDQERELQEEDTLETAVSETRTEASDLIEASAGTSALWNIVSGVKEDTKSTETETEPVVGTTPSSLVEEFSSLLGGFRTK